MVSVHSAGIIHRDIKLERILLDDENHDKLSYFCLCTFTRAGRKDYDEKVDVYAFGVVVFVILTNGERPDISSFDVGIGKKASIPSNSSEFSKNLIEKCWSFKASDRPTFSEINEMLRENKSKLI
ncbi:hypothetical protein M9Y10_039489 [Tritrichomonas musculus]|uniref:Protein kinase domain-containing protein n=1 Tax=Tritrichomonas musculus TaxID=1915356 RepID=A0ABR2KBD5_9EUKA